MSEFVSSRDIYNNLQKNALGGAKLPHRVSLPVVRKVDNSYVITSFIFIFTREHIQQGILLRPIRWITADIHTGNIIKEYDCKELDFSTQAFDKVFNIRTDKDYNLTKEFYDSLYERLDEIRKEYYDTGKINDYKYDDYLKSVINTIPPEYQIFFKELSLI